MRVDARAGRDHRPLPASADRLTLLTVKAPLTKCAKCGCNDLFVRKDFPQKLGLSLVILESWLTALGYLHRCRPLRLKARWTIFLAALVPWLVGLGIAVTVMLSLFWVSDLVS